METKKLVDPILIAAWPGMGHVAITACYYMISRLKMEFRVEYASSELFDVDHVAVEQGLVQRFRYPRNQIFVWQNPDEGPDLLVFIGEAQPPQGRYDFCRKLVDFAQREGVSKIFTFAALATGIDLMDPSRTVGAAIDTETMHGFLEHDVGLLRSGSISGMNGVLLGVAAERNMTGGCLLGEMPAMFVNIPYPRASIGVLDALSRLTGIGIEMAELKLEAEHMEAHLSKAVEHIQRISSEQGAEGAAEDDETYKPDPSENGRLSIEEQAMLEDLFEKAKNDRSHAFALKRELDRLDVFRDFEDRFLDLFKKDDEA